MIKITGMIFPYGNLKFPLEIRQYFMIGFYGWSKIIGAVYTLFMKINMNLGHPRKVLR